MITVEIVAKRFGETPVLGPMSFSIAPGERVALLGPSGIGKSTLLRIVSGIDKEFEGQVEAPENRAFVFQEPTLLPWRTSLDNLLLVHPGLPEATARDSLDRVGLSGKAAYFPGQLSLGQQRRLSLARAFAGAPAFLIMDEPFVSLDEETGEAMLALTDALLAAQCPSLLFVTHDPDEASRLAKRFLRLSPHKDGARLMEIGSPY